MEFLTETAGRYLAGREIRRKKKNLTVYTFSRAAFLCLFFHRSVVKARDNDIFSLRNHGNLFSFYFANFAIIPT